MRKAGQVGLWLVLAAASWTPVAAMAQDDMFPDGPPQLASDEPVVAAASTAWHDAWRASVETHLRAVAARGTPRDLLVAGWLWPVEDEEERIEAANSFFRPQARAWIQAAYDGARGDDVLVDWTLLDACEMAGATCDRAVLLQRLMAADPGNAEILLTAYQDAHERGDAAAAERYWQAASEGERYHSRINELGALMASVLRQAHAPAMDPALATALGKDLGLGRSATPDDMANMAVMSLNAAIAMPTLRAITQRCTARVGLLPDGTLAACRRLYALLAADESTLMGPLIALPRFVEWADTPTDRAAARERLRRFAWVYENAFRRHQLTSSGRSLPADYIDRFFRDGELAAMRHQLQLDGIAIEPPAGWLPENPEWRARLAGTPVPATP